jgi:hypothetical protein
MCWAKVFQSSPEKAAILFAHATVAGWNRRQLLFVQ